MPCRATAKSALRREWMTISASRCGPLNFKQRWNAPLLNIISGPKSKHVIVVVEPPTQAPGLFLSLWLGPDQTIIQKDFSFQQSGIGYLWWGLYSITLCCTTGRSNASLAFCRSNAGRSWAGGDYSGSLIIVTQFVGFLGGWNHPGQLPPLLAAPLGL